MQRNQTSLLRAMFPLQNNDGRGSMYYWLMGSHERDLPIVFWGSFGLLVAGPKWFGLDGFALGRLGGAMLCFFWLILGLVGLPAVM